MRGKSKLNITSHQQMAEKHHPKSYMTFDLLTRKLLRTSPKIATKLHEDYECEARYEKVDHCVVSNIVRSLSKMQSLSPYSDKNTHPSMFKSLLNILRFKYYRA